MEQEKVLEKPEINSAFITSIIAYQWRNDQAFGISQPDYFLRGLIDYRDRVQTSTNVVMWQAAIERCEQQIEQIQRDFIEKKISSDMAMSKAKALEKIIESANEHLGLTNG